MNTTTSTALLLIFCTQKMTIFFRKSCILFLFIFFYNGIVNAQCADTSATGDCDGDTILNGVDLDDDNDGILDIDESDCSLNPIAINTPGYALNTDYSGTSLPDMAAFNGTDVDVSYVLLGTAVWNDGVEILNGAGINPDGNYINFQARSTNFTNGDVAIYTLDFNRSGVRSAVSNLSFRLAGLDNGDTAKFQAFHEGVEVAITQANITNINIDPTDYFTTGNNTIRSESPAANAPDNAVEFSILTQIDQIVITTAKDPVDPRVTTSQIYNISYCVDRNTDADGIPDALDLDSDDDGCPDAIEAGVPSMLLNSGVNANDGIVDNTENAIIDITSDPVGTNGYANSLEDVDTSVAVPINSYVATNYDTYALDNTINGCGVPIITQVYRDDATNNKYVEITNIHPTNIVVPNAANVNFFDNGVTTSITASFASSSEITPNTSVLFKNTGTLANIVGTPIQNVAITSFDGINDIVTISRSGVAGSQLAYDTRTDIIQNIRDKTAYVRSDETALPNNTYTASEWVAFVDDALNPYRDAGAGGPERHPHDPLLSEITTSNTEANTLLGLHRFGPTTRTATAWNNGFPDRSRRVIISEDYIHTTSTLSARTLTVNGDSKLSVTDNLVVVSDALELTNTNDEIRLIGTSQLILTHANTEQINGSGKLYVDQNSEIPSTYRYNYFGSPVNSIGGTTYTVADVFKDGTTPTSASSAATDINFIGGSDGATTTPISIAQYWIYTFGASNSWVQKFSTGTIPQTDGVIFKGPGQAQNYTFVGTPKDGTMQTTVAANTYYLVGNPYASAISAKKFIEDNITTTTGALYFWEHKESIYGDGTILAHYYNGYVGGYAIRNIAMGLAANNPLNTADDINDGIAGVGTGVYREPGAYVPIGQGFFVEGNGTGGAIIFNNSQREYILEGTNAVFFRNGNVASDLIENSNNTSSNTLPIIKLGMNYVNEDGLDLHRQIGISFSQSNSFAFDIGYDAPANETGVTDIYWDFENDDKNYAIAGVQEITNDLEVPITISIGYTGSLKIRIDEWANVNRNVYLIDKLENTSYLISNTPANIFLNTGTYSGRFFLAFSTSSTLGTTEVAASAFYIYTENTTEEIIIMNANNTTIENVELYDILGKKIQSWRIAKQDRNKSKLQLKTNKTASGIYYLKLQSEAETTTKKVYLGVN